MTAGWGGQPLVDMVVAATAAAAATAVVSGGCDGGDFVEVERRRVALRVAAEEAAAVGVVGVGSGVAE
nr:hypothetical protein [Tanacetum cinerariifolium]